MFKNEFILTDEKSNKVLHMPTNKTTKASVRSKMHHNLLDPSRTVDMVPALKHNSLISEREFADAN